MEAVGEGVAGIDQGARAAWTMVPGVVRDPRPRARGQGGAAAGRHHLPAGRRGHAPGDDRPLPRDQHVSLAPRRRLPGPRGRRRRRPAADAGRQAHRRPRLHHRLHRGEGQALQGGRRRRGDPLHERGLPRGREEADLRGRGPGGLRLGGPRHVREEPRLPGPARDARPLRPVERRRAALRRPGPEREGLAVPDPSHPRATTRPRGTSSSPAPGTSSPGSRTGASSSGSGRRSRSRRRRAPTPSCRAAARRERCCCCPSARRPCPRAARAAGRGRSCTGRTCSARDSSCSSPGGTPRPDRSGRRARSRSRSAP